MGMKAKFIIQMHNSDAVMTNINIYVQAGLPVPRRPIDNHVGASRSSCPRRRVVAARRFRGEERFLKA